MARDFLSDQIRTSQIIGSGSQSLPKITVISDAEAPNNDGTISSGVLDNVGSDVFLFVSGTIDGKANNTADSVTLFGGDVVVSGTLYAENQVIEVIAESTGSLGVSGSIEHTGGINIGDAEDGSYADGLFTDFTSSTLLGVAIDRFNEVLKGLAPNQAPDLDNFSALPQTGSGISAKLSFGASNDQSSAGYSSVIALNDFSDADVNDLYEPVSPISGSYKLGIFSKNTDITGVLNEDKAADIYPNTIVNYPENSFSNADEGTLRLELNGNVIHSVALSNSIGTGDPGSGTGSDLNINGSGFINLSASAPGRFSSDLTFNTFRHRTGSWIIKPADQENGFNYAQVIHVIGSEQRVTGTAQWVNDNNSELMTASNNSLSLSLAGSKYLSGVQYFTSGDATYSTNIDNFYKYVYGDTPVTFNETTTPNGILSLSNFSIPAIGVSEDHTKVLQISKTSNISLPSNQKIIDGQISVTSTISHPRKNISSLSTQATASQILIDNVADSSTKLLENFDDEVYRMISTTYAQQADVSSGNYWDSTQTITSGNTGYLDGLLVHNGKLMSTKNPSLPNSGNFSTMQNGPANNPDYSNGNILGNTKKYFRRFTNTSGNTVRDISYNILGNAVILGHGAALGSDTTNIKVYYKLPGSTAWLDTSSDFVYNNVSSDGDGGNIGTTFNDDITVNPTNYLTFGTAEVLPNEDILIKIESNKTWQGVVDRIEVGFGAVGTVLPSPNTDNVDVNNLGATGKLSFGSSLAKVGYTNVGSIGSSTAVDVNQVYSISSFTNNTRRGIFDGNQLIEGEINEDVSSQGNNYPDNAWGSGKANVGELKFELNGTIIPACTIDLATFTNGDSLDANNTGFVGISAATVGKDNNNLPDYRYFYRTGSFQVSSASQRNGWNYLRVLHDLDGGSTVYETNYAEWLNTESSTISYSNITIDTGSFVQGSTAPNYLSGINYFTSAKSNISLTADSVYKNVYSNLNNAISFPITNNSTIESITVNGTGVINGTVNASSRTLPNLDTSVPDAYDQPIDIEATFSYDISKSIPGSLQVAGISCQINHPIEGNEQSVLQNSPSPLIYTVNDTETNLVENFSAESYRLQAGAYNNQTDVNSGTWDSAQSLIGANTGHNSGLQYFDNKLVAPSIDFSNTANMVGPINNLDYSTATGTRTLYRKIRNETVSSKFNFALTVQGAGTLVDNTTTLSGANNNFKMFIKLPNTTNSQSTGWLDFRLPFQTGQVADNDGCRTGGDPNTMTNTLSPTGTLFEGTFGTQYAFSDATQLGDYVVVKIEADSSWTGNISNIEFEWR